jgi:flagellar assembly factor FliW
MPHTALSAAEPSADSPEHAIVFPEGLVGCQSWKRFFLMTDTDDAGMPVAVLQSIDHAHVTLLVTNPTIIDPSYAPQLSPQDRLGLGLTGEIQPTLFCTLTISDDGWLTANLLGPLVVNPLTHQGKQIVLVDSAFTTRHKVARISGQGEPSCSS